MRAKPDKHIKY